MLHGKRRKEERVKLNLFGTRHSHGIIEQSANGKEQLTQGKTMAFASSSHVIVGEDKQYQCCRAHRSNMESRWHCAHWWRWGRRCLLGSCWRCAYRRRWGHCCLLGSDLERLTVVGVTGPFANFDARAPCCLVVSVASHPWGQHDNGLGRGVGNDLLLVLVREDGLKTVLPHVRQPLWVVNCELSGLHKHRKGQEKTGQYCEGLSSVHNSRTNRTMPVPTDKRRDSKAMDTAES